MMNTFYEAIIAPRCVQWLHVSRAHFLIAPRVSSRCFLLAARLLHDVKYFHQITQPFPILMIDVRVSVRKLPGFTILHSATDRVSRHPSGSRHVHIRLPLSTALCFSPRPSTHNAFVSPQYAGTRRCVRRTSKYQAVKRWRVPPGAPLSRGQPESLISCAVGY
jgi:hypothetical protein